MKKRKVLYIILIILLIVLSNVSLYYYFYFDDIRLNTKDINVLLLNEKSSITYNIESADNNYYNSKNISNYDVNNINTIDTFYNYSITFDKKVTGNYSYYIRGVLFDSADEMKEIYKSTEYKYDIEDKNVININQLTNINIKDIINKNLEIADYNDAKIKYELVVMYHIYNKDIDKYVSNSKTIEINIPITSGEYITISPNEEKSIKEFSNLLDSHNKTYLIICIEFLGSVVLYILCIAYLIENMSPSYELNDKELSEIIKKYKKDLVKINFLPDLSRKEVIFVDNMNELLAYSKSYNVPIDYIEIVKHKETIFTVIYDKNAYVYKVSVKRK